MDTLRIGNCLTKLQDFYGHTLSIELQEEFIEYCLDTFRGIAQVEKSVSLLIRAETNYGRIPNFGRLKEVFDEYVQVKRPEYQTPNPKAAEPAGDC